MPSPDKRRTFRRVVVREIMVGKLDFQPFFLIPKIFVCQRAAVIFRMAKNKHSAAVMGNCNIKSGNIGIGENL